MKTQRTIQTKRTRPKTGYRILHAATRFTKKRKQRASTAAVPDDMHEVPGVGVARALIVMLLLHVAAIAGIYLHNRWSESSDIKATIAPLKEDTPPSRLSELRPHTVTAGDNYEKIAYKYGVDRDALFKVNEGKDLKQGWIINIPNRREEAVRPAEIIGSGLDPLPAEPSYTHRARPLIQSSENESYPGSRPGALVPVEGSQPEPSASALLIKPRKPAVQAPPPRRETYQAAPQPRPRPVATGRRHIVREGETLWRIANNNGISVDALKRANPNANVSALKIGASLLIPPRR